MVEAVAESAQADLAAAERIGEEAARSLREAGCRAMARVVLTQPSPRVGALQRRLRELGHEPLALPTSRIVDLTTDRAVRDVVARLADFDWIVLVSPAAIGAAARLPDAHWPAATGIAVIGPGSLQALLDSGLPVEPGRVLLPAGPRFDAQALIATAPLRAAQGLRILVLRGEGGNDRWIEQLRARGAIVETCALYRREPIEPPRPRSPACGRCSKRARRRCSCSPRSTPWRGSRRCWRAPCGPGRHMRRRRWQSMRASSRRSSDRAGATCGRSRRAIGRSRPR